MIYGVLPMAGVDIRDYSEPILSPSYTYRVDLDNDRIAGYVDNDEALKQAIILALYTEQGRYEIYPEDYGMKLSDLYGLDPNLVKVRLPRRIEECLLKDLRIEKVEVKDIVIDRNTIRCTVICNGNIEVDYELEI